jgi:hypothetical protein
MNKHPLGWICVLAVGALVVGSQLSIASGATAAGPAPTSATAPAATGSSITGIDCGDGKFLCAEIPDSDDVFGHYVGHDEPTLVFSSNQPGSGNRVQYSGILPKEPAPTNVPGAANYDFQLYATFWYGMALCATESYPNTVDTCIPDSDQNITKAGDPNHAGTAYLELQFYPPGYVQWFNGYDCTATQWCVALTIDSFARNPVTGQDLNPTCRNRVGLEYVNFALLTKDGVPQGPANPVDFNPFTSGTPDPNKTAFLNPGDHYTVTMHDTEHGLQTIVQDTTTGTTGSMIASAANGFGQVKFDPTGTSCTNVPYDFHPEYSTSTAKTTAPWTAAPYNVALDTEIGHFDYCSAVDAASYSCTGSEGPPGDQEPTDFDDNICFPGSAATLIQIGGCIGPNLGFDGTSYQHTWPDGSSTKPTPTIFTSPKTGPHYNVQYPKVTFSTDLPAVEQALNPACDADTGANCTLHPPTDDGTPAAFYPYYTSGQALGGCAWTIGQNVPGFSTRDYGQLAQYGNLLKVTFPALNGGTISKYNAFQKTVPNPCPAP